MLNCSERTIVEEDVTLIVFFSLEHFSQLISVFIIIDVTEKRIRCDEVIKSICNLVLFRLVECYAANHVTTFVSVVEPVHSVLIR